MKVASHLNWQRKGIAVILTAVMLVIIVPAVGLAIDGSMLYAIKARLSAAVDAGALAGARSLSRGMDLSSQVGNATATAQAFFSANFKNGYLMTRNPNVDIQVAETAYKTRTVTLAASVESPLYFMRILGASSATVRAVGMASRRDVNLMLTLDRSSSMASAGVCGTMKANAQDFVDKFVEGRDRLGLITYMVNSKVDFTPSVNFKTASPSLSGEIGQLACGGNTGTAQALWLGYQQLVTINEPGALNLIVLFTDGLPNGLTGTFPVKTQITSYTSPTSPSTCKDSAGRSYPTAGWNPAPKFGAIAQWAGGAPTGTTAGMMNPTGVAISSTSQPTIADRNGCYFASDQAKMRNDIAYIPTTDFYGHSTTGSYVSPETYTSGPYVGKIRVDKPQAIIKASINAVDNAAQAIRANTALGVIIFTIGLGGTTSEPLDHELLRRLANDPSSSFFDSSKPAGLYVYAPAAAQLNEAFARVASEILRLAL